MPWNFCPNCGAANSLERPNRTLTRCTNCGYTHYNNAKGSVALAFVHDNQLLISRRGHKNDANYGMYELPGGFVDFGESAQAAAIREAHEELGITVAEADLQLIDVYYNDYNVERFNSFSIDLVFLITTWQGEPQADSDVQSISWQPFSFVRNPSFCQKHYGPLEALLRQRFGE